MFSKASTSCRGKEEPHMKKGVLCSEHKIPNWLTPPVSDQVIRNFELMGRVNLDQLEMIKEQGSSAEEEEERGMMEMVVDGKVAAVEEEEEDDEDEDEGMVIMQNIVEDQREMDDEEIEDNIKEEEEEEEDEEEVREVEEERPALQGKYRWSNTDLYLYSFLLCW